MAWTSIPSTDLDPESPLTTSLMNALYDNVAAAMNQDSGAPAPATNFISSASQLQASVVHQSELSTGTGATSTTSSLNFTMTGGTYVFAPQVRISATPYRATIYGIDSGYPPYNDTTSFLTQMFMQATLGGGTAYAQYRYINSSPPYDLGDGEIPVFIFAIIDNATQEVTAIGVSSDPPWVHNGPTKCVPDVYDKNGTGYVVRLDTSMIDRGLVGAEKAQAILAAPKLLVPVTQEIKHADMEVVPHPFTGNDLQGKTVVIMDPVSDLALDLAELHQCGECVNDLFHDGYIIVGNESLGRRSPAAVLDVAMRWKNTAGR